MSGVVVPIRPVRHSRRHVARFVEFHAQHPKVAQILADLTREWLARTRSDRASIQQAIERARWEIQVTTADPQFRIDNSFAPFYARLLMLEHDDLAGVFELRQSVADEWAATLAPAVPVAA